jgi:CRISPR-associated protein Cmr5
MNRIEKYIPKVMRVLEDEFKDRKIDREYNGYISSFGAGVMMSGLKPTVAMFENVQANTQKDRKKLMTMILRVLDEDAQETKLLDYILNRRDEERIIKSKILDIATAMKLCIRTFELKKEGKNE